MKYFQIIGEYLHVLSLDISLGATIMAAFISERFGLQVPFIQFIMLFQVVWAIYLADHLYDSRKKEAVTPRRIFFIQYGKQVAVLFMLNLIILILHFILWGTSKILLFSIPVAVITMAYLFVNWYAQARAKSFYAKEICIAAGYSGGVMVIPLAYAVEIEPFLWWITAYIFMLAFWNVLMIAFFEEHTNKQEGQTAMHQWLSVSWITRLAGVVILVYFGLIVTSGFLFDVHLPALVTWVAMGIWCLVVWGTRFRLRRQRNYILWVDTVFILPLFYLLLKS